jgi:tetratricopeptide (TPR) repeat protein
MSWEVWGPPLVVLLVGLVVGLVLALRARGGELPAGGGERAALRARKDMLMEQLRAMEADRDKLHADEYAARKGALVAEAALVLRTLEEAPTTDAAPARPPTPSRAGARVGWALGTVAFFALLGVGLTEFSRPRGQGETMTGGVGDGSPAPAPAPVSPEVEAARATLLERPDDLDALNVVSYDHLLKGELDAAMKTIDQARAVAPKDPGVLTHLAMLQLAVGMSDRAVVGLEEAIAARPDWARPHLWMGLAQLQAGQPAAAEASLQLGGRDGPRAPGAAVRDAAVERGPQPGRCGAGALGRAARCDRLGGARRPGPPHGAPEPRPGRAARRRAAGLPDRPPQRPGQRPARRGEEAPGFGPAGGLLARRRRPDDGGGVAGRGLGLRAARRRRRRGLV